MEKLLPVIIGATVGAIATAIGWFVTDRLYYRRLRKEATLRHLESQIKELYGPLLGLIQYSSNVYNVVATILPSVDNKQQRTDPSRFSDEHWEAWRFICESYFHPINAEVRNLISSKMHLLESDPRPQSFDAFFQHVAHFECRYKLWKEKEIDTSYMSGPAYPRTFESDVANALARLREQYQNCLRSLGVSNDTI